MDLTPNELAELDAWATKRQRGIDYKQAHPEKLTEADLDAMIEYKRSPAVYLMDADGNLEVIG